MEGAPWQLRLVQRNRTRMHHFQGAHKITHTKRISRRLSSSSLQGPNGRMRASTLLDKVAKSFWGCQVGNFVMKLEQFIGSEHALATMLTGRTSALFCPDWQRHCRIQSYHTITKLSNCLPKTRQSLDNSNRKISYRNYYDCRSCLYCILWILKQSNQFYDFKWQSTYRWTLFLF